MHKMWIVTLCLGLAMNTIASPAQSQSIEKKETKQVTCTGKVVDEQGRPIAGVKVTLYEMPYNEATYTYDSKLDSEADTGTNGVFSFSVSLDSDAFRYGYIVAEKEGLALGFDNWIMQDGDKELEIRLGKPKELAGTIIDENGMPVSDAQVIISMLVIGQKEERKSLTGLVNVSQLVTNTDSAGRFKFTGIPAEAMAELLVKKTGRATVSTYQGSEYGEQGLKFTPGRTDIKVALPIEAKVEGIVVEKSTGKPVGGVKVMVWSDRDTVYFRQKPAASNQDGTFSISALGSDRYTLELVRPVKELPDCVAEPVEVITEAGTTKSGIKIELSKGGVLEVKVTDAVNKEPVKEVSVGIRHQVSDRYQNSRSNEGGITRMRLIPGDYQVYSVYKKGYSRQRVQDVVAIEDGKTQRLEYELIGMPKITGIVRDKKGKPIEGAALQVCPTGNDASTSDAEGKFEVVFDPGGWPGSRVPTIFLVGTHGQRNLAAAVQMSEDTRKLDLELEPAVTLYGRVVDQDGRGIVGAQVRVWMRGPTWGSTLRTHAPVQTNKEGGFEFKAIPSGQKYTFYVHAEGYGENRRDDFSTSDIEGDRLDVGKLTLAIANLSVSGVVVDDDDEPVVGASVYCWGEGQANSRTQTDTEGKFTLEKVCAGRVRISANKSGATRLYGSIETDGGATDIKIVVSERSVSTRYEPRRLPSLVGRPLPELKEIGIDLPPGDVDGKMLLVCFFDMEQRPSRHCVKQLAKQAGQLKSKGVTVMAVQASKVDQNALDEWVKKYNIPFSVGMIRDDAENARFTWGVRSLPWLILTDEKHIIKASGFPMIELDAYLKGVEE